MSAPEDVTLAEAVELDVDDINGRLDRVEVGVEQLADKVEEAGRRVGELLEAERQLWQLRAALVNAMVGLVDDSGEGDLAAAVSWLLRPGPRDEADQDLVAAVVQAARQAG